LNYKQEIVGDMDSVFYLKESSWKFLSQALLVL
jgi:hypothetical protein